MVTWGVGFHRKLGPMSSTEAELWALQDGLQMAISVAIQPLEVEGDAKEVTQLISGGKTYIIHVII